MVNGLFPGEMIPDAVVGGCIEIYENAWPNPAETIQRVEEEAAGQKVFWDKASTFGDGVLQKARTNRVINVSYTANVHDNPVLQNVHNQYRMLLLATSLPYSKRQNISEELFHEDYQMLRYAEGEEYKQHYDGGTRTGRCVSAITYLNSDYEGGEIEFPFHRVKIKPEPGMLILFPSNYAYAHISHPITKGTKYALVTWLRDQGNFN